MCVFDIKKQTRQHKINKEKQKQSKEIERERLPLQKASSSPATAPEILVDCDGRRVGKPQEEGVMMSTATSFPSV